MRVVYRFYKVLSCNKYGLYLNEISDNEYLTKETLNLKKNFSKNRGSKYFLAREYKVSKVFLKRDMFKSCKNKGILLQKHFVSEMFQPKYFLIRPHSYKHSKDSVMVKLAQLTFSFGSVSKDTSRKASGRSGLNKNNLLIL